MESIVANETDQTIAREVAVGETERREGDRKGHAEADETKAREAAAITQQTEKSRQERRNVEAGMGPPLFGSGEGDKDIGPEDRRRGKGGRSHRLLQPAVENSPHSCPGYCPPSMSWGAART